MLRVLDLFSGIGGFSLGLERTGGFRTVAFCEIEPYCRAVLQKHWPAVPCFPDVRSLHAADVGPVEVICGGFPCQDISVAGKGAGIDGERSGLWSEYARLIGEIRPSYVLVENVAALLGRGLGRVLGDLAEIGYDAEWHCIPAAAVGADHWRDRLWIIAYPDGAGRLPLHERWWEQRSQEVGEDAADGDGARLPRRVQARTLGADARAVGPRLGLALCAAPAFPGLDGAGSPVLGRGEETAMAAYRFAARSRMRLTQADRDFPALSAAAAYRAFLGVLTRTCSKSSSGSSTGGRPGPRLGVGFMTASLCHYKYLDKGLLRVFNVITLTTEANMETTYTDLKKAMAWYVAVTRAGYPATLETHGKGWRVVVFS